MLKYSQRCSKCEEKNSILTALFYRDVRESETEIEKLQRHLKEAEEKNKLLLLENKRLRKALEMKFNDCEEMKEGKQSKQRADQDTASDILHAIFTPGQVKN